MTKCKDYLDKKKKTLRS